jgi:adenylosuccinate synthase
MLSGIAVIGAGFGDEGKGLITDALTRKLSSSLVARFNGGAQAGHTVISGENRHVFGHMSAGTFAGANTYLSSNFIVNPLSLAKELAELSKKNIKLPVIFVHREARVSTIFDMVLNSIAELVRVNRHGSCGLGINETIVRSKTEFNLMVQDLDTLTLKSLSAKLKLIRTEWVPIRAKELGIDSLNFEDVNPEVREKLIPLVAVLQDMNFINHANVLRSSFKFCAFKFKPVISESEIIFEGAQGLALDKDMGEMPYCTPSITGLPSALKAASELGVHTLSPLYVMRVYSTRHGAGPLAHETAEFKSEHMYDNTNIKNEWQGSFRYAPLNLQLLKCLIYTDVERSKKIAEDLGIVIKPIHIAITCIDQVGGQINIINTKGKIQNVLRNDICKFISDELQIPIGAWSYGPESKDVICLKM